MYPRLLLVTDAARSRWPLLELVAEAVAGGVDGVYLRGVNFTGGLSPCAQGEGSVTLSTVPSGELSRRHNSPSPHRSGPGTLWVAGQGGEAGSGAGGTSPTAALLHAMRERIGDRVILLINEPELAEATGAGLHLRERDPLPAAWASGEPLRSGSEAGPGAGHDSSRSLGMTTAARLTSGRSRPPVIGRSVHSVEEAARSEGMDYLLAGHVYASASKPGKPPLGLEGLRRIVAAAPCPVLAIGGITAHWVDEVIRAGASGVAVIGAIAEADDPRVAAATLRAALDRALRLQGVLNDG